MLAQGAYNLGIRLYGWGIAAAALFSPKAKQWRMGRKAQVLPQTATEAVARWWFHCASLGEFEQARPLIEALRARHPEAYIILSFFSPSGYEIRKNYAGADLVCYLPLDLPGKIRTFLDAIRPDRAVFVKYEFWFNAIQVLAERKVPLLLISGMFRPRQFFFQWYGRYFRKQLRHFEHFFVQDEASLNLLKDYGFRNCTLAGDTRIDRVLQLLEEAPEYPILQDFAQQDDRPLLMAGSTWPPDEALLAAVMSEAFKWIIAPHDIAEAHVRTLIERLPVPAERYSVLRANQQSARHSVIVLDTIGMLAYAYRYANLCYVGGAFGKGLHNILEPLAHLKPVIIGPKYHKFKEAVELVGSPALTAVEDAAGLQAAIQAHLQHPTAAAATAQAYLDRHRGATEVIVDYLKAT